MSSSSRTVVLVTGNKGKLAEVESCLAAADISVQSVQIDLPELQEASVAAISRAKVIEAYRLVNATQPDATTENKAAPIPVLVDDTSLSFAALNGLPGPYIKWFLEAVGVEGLVKMTDGFAERHAEETSAAAEPPAYRRAAASCIFSYCHGIDESTGAPLVEQFIGVCDGALVSSPRGKLGFGWDSIFAPRDQAVPFARTFAEMTMEEKNGISHRAKALRQLADFFLTRRDGAGMRENELADR